MGIISDQFGEKRNQAIGLFTTIIPFGGILGPNIGGGRFRRASATTGQAAG
ncbi:MAG: hypothetical protein AAB502_08365 [Chloroflexota bacterium]